ncbi:hypothetical protein [Arthrobacter castelli]|uniref:hypothetical protein n=1 Tax=Arthrobacter castelli TaxID=271431 RepID=UPI0012DEC11E|nr:hypothetical protein [Arthrobacter castelli]
MKKTAAITAALLSGSMIFGTLPATAAPSGHGSGSSRTVPVLPRKTMGGFTSVEWNAIARNAEKAGDRVSAQAARQAAKTAQGGSTAGGGAVQPANIITTLGKKALVAALRYAGPKLPKPMRPYAHKLANVIEEVSEFQEGALITAFQQVRVPYDVAATAAKWCVVFLGF